MLGNGEAQDLIIRPEFNRSILMGFLGAKTTSDAGFLALREIYEETCQPLFALLCFQVGDRDVAKDLMQETYVTALKKLPSYRGTGSLAAWLRVIAVRKSLDWHRTLSRCPSGPATISTGLTRK